MSRLAQVDLGTKLKKSEAKEQLAAAQERLVHLRLLLGGQIGPRTIGPPLLVLFEGWDASGKGGAIKRLVDQLDPRHARVAQFAAPTYDEKRHHFLWRFWPVLPGWGDRKSTRLNSSHANISYAVFCLKKKNHALLHSIHHISNLNNFPLSPLLAALHFLPSLPQPIHVLPLLTIPPPPPTLVSIHHLPL